MTRRRSYRRGARRVGRGARRGLNRIRNVFNGGIIGNGTKSLGASLTTQIVASRAGLGQHAVIAGAGAGYLAGGLTGMVVGETIKKIAGFGSIWDYMGGLPFLNGSGTQGAGGGSV